MKKLILALLTYLTLFWASTSQAGLVVVVHQDNPIESLSSRQIMDLYMGRYTAYPNGATADTTDLPDNSPLREDFYNRLVGKSVAQINAYWARLLFTGKAEPPQAKPSEQDVVNYVRENRSAIAYIKESNLADGLKVVFRFEDPQ
ncbi:hypothetical protein [Enterovibrio nigricans]|uniref:Phosphate ABC transporter substrate-binding protein n=1 Tax=Enterovibrio nigricans DSM 22720 TaxID=1121868 RepID=A0A1T4V202_9GAMM|nr:hypothetical protein [Enterovibrio nigricans]SKA58934.1 hypothetical protein SAMN02745132_03055 [Enterovibrio nigricans DSM 22720]